MKFAGNSEYKVVITRDAKAHLAQILRYLRQDLGSEQAARNVKAEVLRNVRIQKMQLPFLDNFIQ